MARPKGAASRLIPRLTQLPADEGQRPCQSRPELFYAPDTDGTGEPAVDRRARELAAKVLCMQCPIRQGCLDYAVQTGEEHGVWGGTTEDERWALIHAPKRRRRVS